MGSRHLNSVRPKKKDSLDCIAKEWAVLYIYPVHNYSTGWAIDVMLVIVGRRKTCFGIVSSGLKHRTPSLRTPSWENTFEPHYFLVTYSVWTTDDDAMASLGILLCCMGPHLPSVHLFHHFDRMRAGFEPA